MYRYDEIDQRLVDERVRQFRDQTRRFLAGELADLLRDPGLRGVQGFRRLGEVQTLADGLPDVPQLLEVHITYRSLLIASYSF